MDFVNEEPRPLLKGWFGRARDLANHNPLGMLLHEEQRPEQAFGLSIGREIHQIPCCLLYTSDAADE